MTVYELLLTLEPDNLNRLVRAGIIIHEWQRALRIYEYFQECCTFTGRMDAYDRTGEKFFMSDENVRRIVRKLSAPVSD